MREERRLVTVSFADVVGSTALAEELDPEDVRALLSRYYAVARDVVESHGGSVAKLLGDGVLAVFGVPAAHGDDAQRALDAMLALRDRVMRDEALQRLQLRIGVNTGEVVATEDAKGEIVGDTLNVAARIAAAAQPDEILAADATHRAARAFSYGERREIAAKGKSQPVRTWPVRSRGSERASGAPFVGREEDLAQLELAARRAFRDRRPYLVTITAPDGAGKSRLVDELRRRSSAETWYARAACPPYGATALGPLRELLLGLFGLSPDASADDVRREVGAVLDEADVPRDTVLIAATVAPEAQSDERERDAVFAAWRRLIERLASDRPLLLVFDDLQWASDTLLDLIEHIVRPSASVPLLVTCIARPELLQRRPAWGGGRRNAMSLSLEPLTPDDITRLVAQHLETEPPARLRELVVERAAGNPFFAEEMVRSLLERGLDATDPAAVDAAMGALPETVQGTLLARIDMLSPDERAVLQSSAVVGLTVDAETLRAICELAADPVADALARLVDRELLSRGQRGEYAFANALVREVAYGMLPRARRARDHAMVAQHLQVSSGARIEEFAGLVGYHYLQATRLRRASAVGIPIEGADDETTRSGAVVWLARSARANAGAGAWTEAIAQIQAALALANDDEQVPLLMQLGETSVGGNVGWDALTDALARWRARTGGDEVTGARILVDMLRLQLRSGVSISPDRHPDEATLAGFSKEALELAKRGGDERVHAAAVVMHAYLERSRAGRTRTSLESARDEATRAAAVLERHGDWSLWSMAVDAWAAIVGDLGDLRAAHDIAMRRIEHLEELPGIERAHAHWTMPLYALALGELEAARDHVRRALAQPTFDSSKIDPNIRVAWVFLLSWRAAIAWLQGRWDDVLIDAREANANALRMPEDATRSVYSHAGTAALYVARRRGRDDVMSELGAVLRRWVDDERALAVLDDDPRHLDARLDRMKTAGIDTWQVERSASLLAAYRVAVDASRLDPLIADAEARGLRPLLAQLLRLRGRARSDAGDLRRARDLLAQLGMRADAALATLELGALTRDAALLDAAESDLASLGDHRGLAQVAEARASG